MPFDLIVRSPALPFQTLIAISSRTLVVVAPAAESAGTRNSSGSVRLLGRSPEGRGWVHVETRPSW